MHMILLYHMSDLNVDDVVMFLITLFSVLVLYVNH